MYSGPPASSPAIVMQLQAENAKLRADGKEARAVIRDLLESYLATFEGNKDELVYRAEKIMVEEALKE